MAESRSRRLRRELDQQKKEADLQKKALEAENKRLEAERRADQAQNAQERQAEQAAHNPAERAYQLAINAAGPVVGMAAGYTGAHMLEKRHLKALAAQAPQTKKLAGQAAKLMDTAAKGTRAGTVAVQKLTGVIKTAESLGLVRVRGPVGAAAAGLMIAEGAFARFVLAPQIENETAKEGARAIGTASMFAASTLFGHRMIQNATLTKLPAAEAISTLNQAKEVIAGRSALGTAAKVASRGLSTAGRIAGKAFLPLTVAMAAYDAINGYKKGGAGGAAMEVADGLTFGLASSAARMIRGAPSSEPQRRAMAAIAARSNGQSASLALARTAAQRASMPQVNVGMAAGPMPATGMTSDGRTEGYRRQQNGKTVFVRGYQTPKR